MRIYLNEQKAVTLDQAAILAEEFVLTHKINFTVGQYPGSRRGGLLSKLQPFKSSPVPDSVSKRSPLASSEERHIVADCPVLSKKVYQTCGLCEIY